MAEIASLVQCGFNPQQAKHIAAQIGWCDIDELWAYASASTITVPTDATTRFQVGDKIRLTQTTVKYFYVIAVAATTITLSGGSDYTVSNEAISSIAYSRAERPFGFPDFFNYTSTLGGIMSGSVTFARFSMKGKLVFVGIQIDLTWINQALTATLPISVGLAYTAYGSVYAPSNWEVGRVMINENTDTLVWGRYDGTFYNTAGGQARGSATYEIG